MSRFRPHDAKPKFKHLGDSSPCLFFTPKAIKTMQVYVEECSDEIGWLGIVEAYDDNVFLCTEVHLLHQDVSGATTEIQPEGLVKYAEEVGMDNMENVRLWGHSHVNGGTSPSLQDDKQMDLFQKNGFPWYFRIIANKRGLVGVTFFNFEKQYVVEDVPWDIHYPAEIDADAIKQEIKTKVTKISYAANNLYSGYASGYTSGSRKFGQKDYVWSDTLCYWVPDKEGEYKAYCDALREEIVEADVTEVPAGKKNRAVTESDDSEALEAALKAMDELEELSLDDMDELEELSLDDMDEEIIANILDDAIITDLSDCLSMIEIVDMVSGLEDFSDRADIRVLMEYHGIGYKDLCALCDEKLL